MTFDMSPHMALSPKTALDKTWRYMNEAFNVVKMSGKLVQIHPRRNLRSSPTSEGSFHNLEKTSGGKHTVVTRRDTVVQRHMPRTTTTTCPMSSTTTTTSVYTTTEDTTSQNSLRQNTPTSSPRRSPRRSSDRSSDRRRHRVHFEDETLQDQDPFIITIRFN
ncbi:LAFA_0D06942g1_1 [Lachancea sp. 'fantastica']|nr:LAFA_0D06942g1_1 [Lachancea sp. 'fantastica']